MGLSNRAILDVVILVYYIPVFPLCVWVVIKHGFGRQVGWIYLAVLATLRIVGASTGIANNSHPSIGLLETTTITYSIGLTPLLLAMLGIIQRVNEGMPTPSFPPRMTRLITIPILVGLIMGIIGGTDAFSSNPNSRKSGVTDTKVAIILFLVAFFVLAGISLLTLLKIGQVIDGEKRLLWAVIASLPFLLVRLIYSLIVDFDRSSTIFSLTSTRNVAVVVQAIMSVAMEFIVVALYLAAGFTVRTIPRSTVQNGHQSAADQYRTAQEIRTHRHKQQTGFTSVEV